jgi:hypothetical protein
MESVELALRTVLTVWLGMEYVNQAATMQTVIMTAGIVAVLLDATLLMKMGLGIM